MGNYVNNEIVRQIKESVSIVALVENYVSLSKSGSNYRGLCPFHDDKNPSFYVNESKGLFHCFSCGAGGDVLGFYMRYNNLTFGEAVSELAKIAGIKVRTPRRLEGNHRKREILLKINSFASSFFHNLLLNSSEAEHARDYAQKRGITLDIIREFEIGFAPPSWSLLSSELERRGIPLGLAEELGLIIRRGSREGYYDRFRDRLIFPIRDQEGRVIGFGGRALGGGDPKYLNSPESLVYHKSSSLYGLHASKDHIRKQGKVILVEGYIDFLALWREGIKNVVATLGTSISSENAVRLRRLAPEAVLIFDRDAAGVKAALRVLGTFLKEGLSPRIVVLPEGNDPDSFVYTHSAEVLSKMVEEARPLLDFYFEETLSGLRERRLSRKEASSALAEAIALVRDPLERSYLVGKAAEALAIPEREFTEFVGRVSSSKPSPLTRSNPMPTSPEFFVLKVLLKHPDLCHVLVEMDVLEYFKDGDLKTILREFASGADVSSILLDLGDNTRAQEMVSLAFFSSNDIPERGEAEGILRDCLRNIHHRGLSEKLRMLRLEIEQARRQKDERLELILFEKHRDLERTRENLRRRCS